MFTFPDFSFDISSKWISTTFAFLTGNQSLCTNKKLTNVAKCNTDVQYSKMQDQQSHNKLTWAIKHMHNVSELKHAQHTKTRKISQTKHKQQIIAILCWLMRQTTIKLTSEANNVVTLIILAQTNTISQRPHQIREGNRDPQFQFYVPWVSDSLHSKEDLDPFSHVCTAKPRDRQTPTPHDHRSQ